MNLYRIDFSDYAKPRSSTQVLIFFGKSNEKVYLSVPNLNVIKSKPAFTTLCKPKTSQTNDFDKKLKGVLKGFYNFLIIF